MSSNQSIKVTGIQANKFMQVMDEFFNTQDPYQTMEDLKMVIDAIKDEDVREGLLNITHGLSNLEFRFHQILKFVSFMHPIYIQNLDRDKFDHELLKNGREIIPQSA